MLREGFTQIGKRRWRGWGKATACSVPRFGTSVWLTWSLNIYGMRYYALVSKGDDTRLIGKKPTIAIARNCFTNYTNSDDDADANEKRASPL